MNPLRCPLCPAELLIPLRDGSGVELARCAGCRNLFCPASSLSVLLACRADLLATPSASSLSAGAAGFCPSDDGGLLVPWHPGRADGGRSSRHAPADGCHRCDQCGSLFLKPEALVSLRRWLPPTPRRAPVLPAPRNHTARAEPVLAESRVGYGDPWLDLLTLPFALAWSALFSLSWFGRLLLFPVQIQFHELGHAIPAWFSGRAALPLPFGFTFWREQQSALTSLLVLALCALLIWRGRREARGFAVLLGSVGVGGVLWLSWLIPAERSRMITILGGGAGELLLSCLALVSFYFRMPDRLRWDFFRFVVVLPAAGAFWASSNMWLRVREGTQAMPMGSLLGREGSGDLTRLMAEYHFTAPELGSFYMRMTFLCGAALLATYSCFALRALRRLRGR